jgi:3-oxosteroid 1-dehydrogenase
MLADGVPDTFEDALTYLEGIVEDAGPATSPERTVAYLRTGPDLVRFLSRLGFRWARAESYPDYYPDLPGGRVGRSIEGAVFDGRQLGPLLATLRRRADVPPLALQTRDFAPVTLALRTPAGAARMVEVLARTARWRLQRRVPLSAGLSLVGQLMTIAVRAGAGIWLDSPLRQLVVEEGCVTGVVIEREGQAVTIRASRGVLLAAGGFARDAGFRRAYQPTGGEWSSAGRADTGDAIKAGMAAGAATALMDEAWWGPSFLTPGGGRMFSVWERSMPGAIIVDQAGERFVNESASYVDVGRALLERDRTVPAVPSWLVLDARHRRRYPFGAFPPGRTPRGLVESGFFLRAGSLGELAGKMGVDPTALLRTVTRFNGFTGSGVDADFGRGGNVYDRYYGDPRVRPNPNLGSIDHPPFWAVRVYPGDLGTKGGLLTDEHGRVLREDGAPIRGLYAAGNTTATVMGRTYPGPGGTIGPAMVFAHLAARRMAGSV